MRNFSSSDSFQHLRLGVVFTPIEWAKFAIQEFGIFEKWLNGATIFDPTMGEGNLLFALIEMGLEKGLKLEELPLKNLFGVELNHQNFIKFQEIATKKYQLSNCLENFRCEDIFRQEEEKAFDIIFGNPPWLNFVDLPQDYKDFIKQDFFKYDLVGNAQDLLLGGSRVDIAALVIQKTIAKNLKKDGKAYFFMPLSLLLNDGANQHFRTYKIHETPYHITKIYDFGKENVFEKVATRYGLVGFERDQKQVFPIPYNRLEKGIWQLLKAQPVFKSNDPLSIIDTQSDNFSFEPIILNKESQPRQGLNTCGANEIYFFDTFEILDKELCRVGNKEIGTHTLPQKFIYPLLTGKNFKEKQVKNANKWVLLPHYSNGKPFEYAFLKEHSLLYDFFLQFKDTLQQRKGTLINVPIQKGLWWALLGVGGYNFFDYKIVWEAYGKTSFQPQIVKGHWQANQSLQAFIPLKNKAEAEKILAQLQHKDIEKYLLSLKMEGTMNWAQPGKIKKFIQIAEPSLSLF